MEDLKQRDADDGTAELLASLEGELRVMEARRPQLVRAIAALRALGQVEVPNAKRANGVLEPLILDALRGRPTGMRVPDLCHQINREYSTVHQKLSNLIARGKVKRVGRGVFTTV